MSAFEGFGYELGLFPEGEIISNATILLLR